MFKDDLSPFPNGGHARASGKDVHEPFPFFNNGPFGCAALGRGYGIRGKCSRVELILGAILFICAQIIIMQLPCHCAVLHLILSCFTGLFLVLICFPLFGTIYRSLDLCLCVCLSICLLVYSSIHVFAYLLLSIYLFYFVCSCPTVCLLFVRLSVKIALSYLIFADLILLVYLTYCCMYVCMCVILCRTCFCLWSSIQRTTYAAFFMWIQRKKIL